MRFWKRQKQASSDDKPPTSGDDGPRGIDRASDVLQATASLGDGTPLGFDWHLDGDMVTMQLVPSAVHRGVLHRGGWWARIEAGTLTPLGLGSPNTSVTLQPYLARISEGDLVAWERRQGVSIPGGAAEYRRLLLGSNGGVPSAPGLVVPARPGVPPSTTIVRLFYGVGEAEHTSIDWALDLYGQRMPAGRLPIADDHCGNMVVLRASGGQAGEVLFWDHEQEESADGPLFPLAPSFSAFMRALRE